MSDDLAEAFSSGLFWAGFGFAFLLLFVLIASVAVACSTASYFSQRQPTRQRARSTTGNPPLTAPTNGSQPNSQLLHMDSPQSPQQTYPIRHQSSAASARGNFVVRLINGNFMLRPPGSASQTSSSVPDTQTLGENDLLEGNRLTQDLRYSNVDTDERNQDHELAGHRKSNNQRTVFSMQTLNRMQNANNQPRMNRPPSMEPVEYRDRRSGQSMRLFGRQGYISRGSDNFFRMSRRKINSVWSIFQPVTKEQDNSRGNGINVFGQRMDVDDDLDTFRISPNSRQSDKKLEDFHISLQTADV